MRYNCIRSRGEAMFTIYMIFAAILVLSFVTGSILLLVEHKPNIVKKKVANSIIFDEEII